MTASEFAQFKALTERVAALERAMAEFKQTKTLTLPAKPRAA
jgi:hypothetical protein